MAAPESGRRRSNGGWGEKMLVELPVGTSWLHVAWHSWGIWGARDHTPSCSLTHGLLGGLGREEPEGSPPRLRPLLRLGPGQGATRGLLHRKPGVVALDCCPRLGWALRQGETHRPVAGDRATLPSPETSKVSVQLSSQVLLAGKMPFSLPNYWRLLVA